MYTVIDFETTGLIHTEEQVIQIGAVKLDHELNEIGSYSTNVQLNAGKKLPQLITNLTGLKEKDLVNGLPEDTALQILNDFIGDSTVVAQFASFDLGFMANHGILPEKFICTKSLFNLLNPNKKAGLKDIIKHYDLLYLNHHDALADAVMTVDVLQELAVDAKENHNNVLDEYEGVMTQQSDRPLRYIPENAVLVHI